MDAKEAQTSSTLEWETSVPEGWAVEVERWTWREWTGRDDRNRTVHLGWMKVDSCPRCGHTMAVYQEAVKSIFPVSTVAARCNCVAHHTGRPLDQDGGCGPGSEVPVPITAHGGSR